MAPHIINIGSTTGISIPETSSSGGAVKIDGTTQPANGYTGISPKIILDGTNVTSGSDQDGFDLWGSGSEVYGMYIRNFPHNAIAFTADNGIIGAPGKGNVLSGNAWNGVYIYFITPNVTVQSNIIGLEPDGITAFGNGDDGVHFWQSSDDGLIGGSGPGEGNTIAYNGGDGIYVRSGINNTLSRNSIFCNTGLGIKLDQFSSGGNNMYPSPVISMATNSAANGTAMPNDIIEIFLSDTVCTGDCEGKSYVTTVIADGSGIGITQVLWQAQLQQQLLRQAMETHQNLQHVTLCQHYRQDKHQLQI